MSTTHEYYVPRYLERHTWFSDSCDSHHLTSNSTYLHTKQSYSGNYRVSVVNGQSLTISCVGSSYVYSNSCPSYTLALKDILHVPCITRNMLYVSKFSKDNNVAFEFLTNKCFIKLRVSKFILLEGFIDSSRLYCFSYLVIEPLRMSSMSYQSSSPLCTNASYVSCLVISDVNKLNHSLLCHYKVSHANFPAIRLAHKHCNISI